MDAVKVIAAYYELCKPRVVVMMLLTALVGMLVNDWRALSVGKVFYGLLGIGLLSCAGGTFNQVLDLGNDRLMRRTQSRPLVKSMLSVKAGFLWGVFLSCAGFLLLFFFVNQLTAFLSVFAFVGYAFVYTCFLKYKTPQNIVIGGFFGALPPLLGWVAITGSIEPYPLVLVMIIFLWTPPHFWALAVARKKEYALTSVPVLPVVYDAPFTGLHMLLYGVLLSVAGVFPYLMQANGLFYLLGSLGLNGVFVVMIVRFIRRGMVPEQSMRLFWFSVYYVPVFFGLLLLDRYFFGPTALL